jgi:hypothetical protein
MSIAQENGLLSPRGVGSFWCNLLLFLAANTTRDVACSHAFTNGGRRFVAQLLEMETEVVGFLETDSPSRLEPMARPRRIITTSGDAQVWWNHAALCLRPTITIRMCINIHFYQ